MSDIKQKRKGEERKGGLKLELSLYRLPKETRGFCVCSWSKARLGRWCTVQENTAARRTQMHTSSVRPPALLLASTIVIMISHIYEWLLTPGEGTVGRVSGARSFGFKELSSSNPHDAHPDR